MTQTEQRRALDTAIRATRAAGRLMRQNLHSKKKVNSQSRHDIKLELDVRCQKVIERALRRDFSDVPLLGEEGDSGDVQSERRWVVDPIDGTVNFAHGIPHACVSIALQSRKSQPDSSRSRSRTVDRRGPGFVTVIGAVYDPFTQELWTAIRGQPARLNGQPVRVSRRRTLAEAVVSIGFAKSKANLEKSLPVLCELTRRCRKVRIMGSAALALTYVATGRFDAYVERRISLWDIAAGGLIIECAGGEFWTELNPDGKTFRVAASNGLLRRRLRLPW